MRPAARGGWARASVGASIQGGNYIADCNPGDSLPARR